MHATVMFHMKSDGPSTQLLQHCLVSKFFLSEPQLHRQLKVCIGQALLYLHYTTGSLGHHQKCGQLQLGNSTVTSLIISTSDTLDCDNLYSATQTIYDC